MTRDNAVGGSRAPARRKLASCASGCLLTGFALFGVFLIFGAGLGSPYTYWLIISDVQIFEGPSSVVLFVEVERTMRYPGFLQEAPIRRPVRLDRVHVALDGGVERSNLKFQGEPTFNTNVAPI